MAQESETPAPSPTTGVTLTPFDIPTPMEMTPSPTILSSPTPPPTPTATPFMYSIIEGDTLIGIAFRYGLTLADLLAANPGIDPQFLTIGTELIIPLSENESAAAALPTPIAFVEALRSPDCWFAERDGLWCFWLLENQGDISIENLAGRITIYDAEGETIDSKTGITPINMVAAGQKMPVLAWFPEGASRYRNAGAVMISAIPLQPEDPRYLLANLDYTNQINGLSAQVSGTLQIRDGLEARVIRMGIIAYGEGDVVVGVRAVSIENPPFENGQITFQEWIYSTGPEIQSVDIVVEAYP